MRKSPPKTPLLALLRVLSDDQRAALAADAGTKVSYLYALASCQRRSCSSTLAIAIEKASERLHRKTEGVTPVICMQQMATMCLVQA